MTRRRRIAFIDYFPTHYRRRMYEELADRLEVDFYFFADERERYWNRKLTLATDARIRRVELRRWRIGGQAVMPGMALALSHRRYDAVVKSLNGKLMLPLTFATAKARRVPFVLWTGMWMHPQTTAHRVSRPLTDAIYRRAEAIVPYGDHVRDFVLRTPGVRPEKVFVAGQAVEGERFEAVPRAEDDGSPPEFVYVGQFEERKGLSYLLGAVELLGDTPLRLSLVGNGSQEAELRARADGGKRVSLRGFVPQAELPRVLCEARALVLPSVTTALDKEPWGLVVNEAMHAGLPVVTTDSVGAAAGGLVRDGANGFVVPERSAEALAGAIRRLAEDPALAERLGRRAREDVQRYTHARMAEAFASAVEYAIEHGGR